MIKIFGPIFGQKIQSSAIFNKWKCPKTWTQLWHPPTPCSSASPGGWWRWRSPSRWWCASSPTTPTPQTASGHRWSWSRLSYSNRLTDRIDLLFKLNIRLEGAEMQFCVKMTKRLQFHHWKLLLKKYWLQWTNIIDANSLDICYILYPINKALINCFFKESKL